jgi:multiple sugar transport system permease protein
MVDWLDTPLISLGETLAIPRMWLVMALASALVGWVAGRKRHDPWLWGGLGFGVFVLISEFVRSLIPDAGQAFARGEQPGASYVLWSDPAFRSDFVLVVLILALLALVIRLVSVLRRYSGATYLNAADETIVTPVLRWRLSAVGSAFVLCLPLILWGWVALWLVFVADYTAIILPALGFIMLATLAGVLWAWLEGGWRTTALLALAVAVLAGQARFNATHPPASMFESSGAVPVFMPLIPLVLGVLVASAARRQRQIAALAWQVGLLAWGTAVLGWLVKFMGYYDYQNSYAFDLGAVLETPVRWLVALTESYYRLIPREINPEDNLAHMGRMEAGLAFLIGVILWGAVAAHVWQLPVRTRRRRLSEELARLSITRLSLEQRRYVLAFVLILPALALRTFTTFYPFLQTIILSVQKYNPAFPPRRYIALKNFERLSTDLVVRESLEFTILFVIVSTFFQVLLGLIIAHLLNANFRLRGMARTISLIPWAIPMVVAAIGFRWMFDDQFGMIPDLLRRVGYTGKWLVNPENARVAVTFVNVWKSTPFAALLLLAGLQGISQELYEAAKVDGANWFDALRFITVPMLLPIIVTISMFLLVWQLAVFDLPFAMTGGGPGFATTVVAQKVYYEINSLNFSYAAAISIALVIVVTVVGGLGIFTLRRVEVRA